MSPSDLLKLAVILPLFFLGGPLLGAAIKGRENAQRWLFGLMCFMTINGLLSAGNWGLTLGSIEAYRGHAKGFHFYFNHILAIALLTSVWLENRKGFFKAPPGSLLYALYVGCSTLSIINAVHVEFTLMALHKMVFFSLIFFAAFHWLRTPERLKFFTCVMAGTMVWQAFVVLKMKYLDGIYQVRGTFEHQNPLAMFSILIGMPLLAVTLGPAFRGRNLCAFGFLACAIIVQGALSRAALFMFAAGTVAVALASILEKPTSRRFATLGVMGAVGALGLLMTLDTILSRFNDRGNTASSELRQVLNEAARQMVRDHPLGIGWNHYALCINPPYPYAELVNDWTRGRGMKVDETRLNAPVESHYYLILSENGWLGLGSYLLMISVALWRNLRGFLSFGHSFERCLCLGILAGCSLNYVQSTLERVLTQPRNLMLWLILFGVTARLEIMRRGLAAGKPGAKRSTPTLESKSAPERSETLPRVRPCLALAVSPSGPSQTVAAWPTPSWASGGETVASVEVVREVAGKRQGKRLAVVVVVASLLAGVLAAAHWRGSQPRLMVYNETGSPLPGVVILAAGQSHEVGGLDDEESHRWIASVKGSDGPVTLLVAPGDGSPAWRWVGTAAFPRSGQRLTLHILGPGQVEENDGESPWLNLSDK